MKLGLKLFCTAIATTSIVLATSKEVEANSASINTPLPTHVSVGYWHDFYNGSNKTKLRNVNSKWDVLNVSFIETKADRYTPNFVVDSDIYSGTETERDAEFISDVNYLHSLGKKVVISFGGQNGVVSINNESQYTTFKNGVIAVINKYGFDGFDYDVESNWTNQGDTLSSVKSPLISYMVRLSHDLKNTFGANFIISAAPEHPYVQGGLSYFGNGSISGSYLPFINQIRNDLTYIHPQYYNNPIDYWAPNDLGGHFSGYSANSLIKLSEMLIKGFDLTDGEHFNGLKADQVAFGVPSSSRAASNGYISASEYSSALSTLMSEYPTFRGIMTWSTNWDELNNNQFINTVYPILHR